MSASRTTIDARIAIVEDDASLGSSLVRFLKACGYRSVLYESAEAFLADEPRPWFDCLVVDIQLGGMTGIALHDRLRASGVSTPVVLMTASCDTERNEVPSLPPGTPLVLKTDPGDALLATVVQLIDRRRAQNDARRDDGDA